MENKQGLQRTQCEAQLDVDSDTQQILGLPRFAAPLLENLSSRMLGVCLVVRLAVVSVPYVQRTLLTDWSESMQTGESYLLNSHLVAIESEDGKTIVDLPAGTTVRLADSSQEESGLVHVISQGRSLIMFGVDLEERGTLLEDAAADEIEPIGTRARSARN